MDRPASEAGNMKRFRFSIKTLFVTILVVACAAGFLFAPANHTIEVPSTFVDDVGTTVDVFAVPLGDVDGGFRLTRIVTGSTVVKKEPWVSKKKKQGLAVTLRMRMIDKLKIWQTENELMFFENKLNEDEIWVD
jgi:hypothetical protein